MQTITLNNGIKMPLLGYGTYQIPNSEAQRCVEDALSVGYRLIDTAQAYANEQAIGEALKSAMKGGGGGVLNEMNFSSKPNFG